MWCYYQPFDDVGDAEKKYGLQYLDEKRVDRKSRYRQVQIIVTDRRVRVCYNEWSAGLRYLINVALREQYCFVLQMSNSYVCTVDEALNDVWSPSTKPLSALSWTVGDDHAYVGKTDLLSGPPIVLSVGLP